MSSHQGKDNKAVPQGVEMEDRLLDDIVGAESEPIHFTTKEDFLDASTHYVNECKEHGSDSPEASIANARREEVRSRLHPMDK
jgi:hypothetical protein